jgi:hypothetical protein
VFYQPLVDFLRFVHRVPVHDQEYFASFQLPYYTAQEFQKNFHSEAPLEDHKAEVPMVGDGRDRVTPEALAAAFDDRRHTLLAPSGPCLMIRAESRFVTPPYLGFFDLGLLLDGGIFVLKPVFDLGWILLQGPFRWFLGCQTPFLEVAALGPAL